MKSDGKTRYPLVKKIDFLGFLPILVVGLIILFVFDSFVPYDMDEFFQYRPIICSYYPYTALWADNCRGIDLNLLNTTLTLPLRTGDYTGSLPSLYYYPIFLLWKSPTSARLMGIIFIGIQSLILGRLFNVRPMYVFIGLVSFFEYFFQHMVDTGPVGFQITSVYVFYALVKKWAETPKSKYLVSAAVLAFLGLWVKTSYTWLLPALFIILAMHVWENRWVLLNPKNRMTVAAHLVISSVVFVALALTLFLSTDPANSKTYIRELLDSPMVDLTSMDDAVNVTATLNRGVVQALINPFEGAKKVYFVSAPTTYTYAYDVLLYLTIPTVLYLVHLKKCYAKDTLRPTMLVIGFAVTILFTLSTQYAWFAHHTILSYSILVLAFFESLSLYRGAYPGAYPKVAAVWLVIFIVANGYFFYYLKDFVPHTINDPSLKEINVLLGDEYMAKNYAYVMSDWGIQYIQGLYGNRQQVIVSINDADNQTLRSLRELQDSTGRKMLLIYNTKEASLSDRRLADSFHLKPCTKTKDRVWRILLEDDQNPRNICLT